MAQESKKTYIDKILSKTGPRKLLALDSGGVRGAITIEILAEIERILRIKFKKGDDFVLADYFDYIGGTSVGAIIATCLSLGMPVDQIRTFFADGARAMFQKTQWWQRWRYKYRCDKLKAMIKSVIENVQPGAPEKGNELTGTLESAKLRTLLMVVMRNASTDSPWPISNNPRAKFNCNPDDPACNLKLPLWQLIRASTAAPTFFAPETVKLGSKTFVFDDGAMTPFGNPAFQLFLMAALEPYKLNWQIGEKDMLLVSLGTGSINHKRPTARQSNENLLQLAASIPRILISASANHQDFLCRVFGKCKVGDPIDIEVDDLIQEQSGLINPKLFTYLRYDADLSTEGIEKLGQRSIRAADIWKIDSCTHIEELKLIGRAASAKVKGEHFADFPP